MEWHNVLPTLPLGQIFCISGATNVNSLDVSFHQDLLSLPHPCSKQLRRAQNTLFYLLAQEARLNPPCQAKRPQRAAEGLYHAFATTISPHYGIIVCLEVCY